MTKYIDPDSPQQLAEYIDTHNVKAVIMSLRQYEEFRQHYDVVIKHGKPTYNNVVLSICIGDSMGLIEVKN